MNTPPQTPAAQWQAMVDGLSALRSVPGGAATFCHAARGYRALQEALPARFVEVLAGLLDRLESSALFTEESCSFSQADLLDNLALWLEKARESLAAGGQAPAATGSNSPPR